ASGSIQEIMDLGLIAKAATLESRIPMLHFFDGFRSSHEINKAEELTKDDMRAMIDDRYVMEHRERALSPDHPVLRGTAQNPDHFMQARETVNKYYDVCPGIVQGVMDRFAKLTGRQYRLFDYVGAPDAGRVIIIMGSGAETVHETVDYLVAKGEKVGVIKVRLYRPWSTRDFIAAIPKTATKLAVLDRTKEPGSVGEPMYEDVRTAIGEAMSDGYAPWKEKYPKVVGGRYGLSSKEFTPAMVNGIFEELKKDAPKNHFTVGITDDVTQTSIDYDCEFSTEPDDVVRALFYGLGSDGTVSANKNSIKIIGEETDLHAQGYFVYDSKKAGAITISHLRFGPREIRSTYLVYKANFIGCHQWFFVEQYDMLKNAAPGGTFLLNSPFPAAEVWDHLPVEVQKDIIDRKLKFYVIDAYSIARDTGMGARINTIMQTCFFALANVLPRDEAIARIKEAVKKTYGHKGQEIVESNWAAIDTTLEHLYEVEVPEKVTSAFKRPPRVSADAPEFVKNVTARIMSLEGDDLPVSAFPDDGTFPTATTQWEKRNVAMQVPVWEPDVCIQCGKCSIVCPHAAIRMKIYPETLLKDAPGTFKHAAPKGKGFEGMVATVQNAPEDCTGCGACVYTCPAHAKDAQGNKTDRKAINLADQIPLRESERENFAFFMGLPETPHDKLNEKTVKGSQLLRPLFEFSGACAGCGETPYVKLMTQLFGDRMVIANATGCSSIYGGNLPTTPYAVDRQGRGPAWSNSLFEDCAEFGFGFRLAIDKFRQFALELLERAEATQGDRELIESIRSADQSTLAGIAAQRERVEKVKAKCSGAKDPDSQQLLSLADYLVRKSVWSLGGDGWAYDIGYGGLDHVLAQGRDINVLVLDSEVYSNTGGQMSKATPLGAVAKFAFAGKPMPKKDLGMMLMTYGSVYVAQVAMGANDGQTVRAFVEAESYDGPSIIIAYSHCIAHGHDMRTAMGVQKQAVETGYWPLYRFDPRLTAQHKNPLQLDSKPPTGSFRDYAYGQTRYSALTRSMPERAEELMKLAEAQVAAHWKLYEQLAGLKCDGDGEKKEGEKQEEKKEEKKEA
ncbi:MAG TPA: pyruvate:ferredoxin (flavodoxin) oxidoreductase, partial [Planctomycetota bacterium]|nr:pyruvate:ferredoxin (flavodoxin) oxidoreductase [Planctomycetota bacterium]